PQFDGTIRLRRRAIADIRMILIFFLKVLQCFLGFLEDVLSPREESRTRIFALPFVHDRLFVGWPIIFGLGQHPTYSLSSFVSWGATSHSRLAFLRFQIGGQSW